MPLWLAIGMGLLGLYQTFQQQSAFNKAMQEAKEGGLSAEEIAELRRQSEGALRTDLARRGLLDSGLLAGGHAKIAGELALAKAKSRLPLQGSYIQALLSQSQGPTLLGSLIPLILQYGVKGVWQPGQAAPAVTTSGAGGWPFAGPGSSLWQAA